MQPPSFRCAMHSARMARLSSRALASCGKGTGSMYCATSGMPVSSDRVRILKSSRTLPTSQARIMPSTSPCGWFATTTSGPVAGMRAISSAGVRMSMPITSSACGQKAAPIGAPFISNRRISDKSFGLAVNHSMVRMVPAFHGLVKVPA